MKRLNWRRQRKTNKTIRRQLHRPRLERLEDKLAPTVFTVNSLLDTVDALPGDGLAADANGLTSLRAAVMEANSHAGPDQIILPSGTYHLTLGGADEDLAATGDLDITGSLTITGGGASTTVISASSIPGGDRVFDCIGSINVHLTGLTVTGGNVGGDGGGILNREGTLSISDAVIQGNTARDDISDSMGGGICNGLRNISVATLELSASVVSGNDAPYGFGGGIANIGSASVSGCQITNNTSLEGGGGILNFTSIFLPDFTPVPPHLTLTDSTVSGNGGSLGLQSLGGGIFNSYYAQATVIRCTINGNLAERGSGIDNEMAQLSLVNSTITSNGGPGLPGGVATFGGGICTFFGPSVIALDHVTLSGNNADAGSGICKLDLPGDGSSFTIANSIIAYNTGREIHPGWNRNYFSGNPSLPTGLTSLGHNIDTDGSCRFGAPGDLSLVDPLLGLLADNGGPTQTRALLPGSPAIDAGDPLDATFTDQRGLFRPADGSAIADIGAYEFGATADVIIGATTPQSFLDSLTEIHGNLILVDVAGRTQLHLPNLTRVDGDFIATGNPDLVTLDAPLLASVGGNVDVSDNPVLTTMNLGSLTTVGGDLNINGDTAMTSVDVSSLTTVGGDLNINGDTAMTSVDVSSLTTLDGSLSIDGDTAMTSVAVSSLTTLDGSLNINGDTAMTTVDVSSLMTVGGDAEVSGNTHMTGLSMGHAHSVGGGLTVSGNTSATNIDLSGVTTVGGGLQVSGNTSATNIDLGSLTTTGGSLVVTGDTSATNIDLGQVTVVGGGLDVSGNTSATNINLGYVTSVVGGITVRGNTSATNIDLGGVTTASGGITVDDNTSATNIDLSGVTAVGGGLDVSGNTHMTGLSMGHAHSVGGSISVNDNTSATGIDLGSITSIGGSVSVNGNTSATGIDLGSITSVSGNLSVDGNTSATGIDLGSITTICGSMSVSGDTAATGIDLGSITSIGGSASVNGDTAATGVDLGSITSIGGSLSVNGDTAATGVDLSSITSVGGDVSLEAKNVITAGTADGSTEIKLFTAEARMTAALAHGTFSGLVPFTVTRLDPAALPPEPGQNSSGGAATIDPLAAYQFHFAISTLGQNATLSFEINLAALSPADRAAFLAALAAGNATVAVKGDAPGSVFHAFAIAAPGQPPDVTHVTITQPDANHVVFQGITGHFSTFAVVTVSGTGNNAPVVTSLAGPTLAVRGQSLHYTGAFTDPDADTWTATVNFGDGSGNQPVVLNPDKTFAVDHVYANTGSYNVFVTVSDNHGGVGTRSLDVSILSGSSLQGFVFEDFNNDGQIDFGENGLSSVTVRLYGTDVLGNTIDQTVTTDANGLYQFAGIFEGSYTIAETQPTGYTQGINTVGTCGGSVSGDLFSVALGGGIDAQNYNFGERPTNGGGVHHGQTAGIGFWNNHNGQALIMSLNGGANATQLGNWLAATFVNIFGAHAGSNNLAGLTNLQVADAFQQKFVAHGQKLDAQVMATALSVYVTNETLAGTTATAYGFAVTHDGVGVATFNVGNDGVAVGHANGSTMSILDILLAADALSANSNGLVYGGNAARRNAANDLFSAINNAGSI